MASGRPDGRERKGRRADETVVRHSRTQICRRQNTENRAVHRRGHQAIDSWGNRAFFGHRQRTDPGPCSSAASVDVLLSAYSGTKPGKEKKNHNYYCDCDMISSASMTNKLSSFVRSRVSVFFLFFIYLLTTSQKNLIICLCEEAFCADDRCVAN